MTETVSPVPAQRIVIVGDNLSAWMAAAALARTVSLNDYQVSVVGDGPENDAVPLAIADSTLPSPTGEHFAIELDEERLVAETGAAFTYGIALSGWSAPGATYFHPFGAAGAGLGSLPFHQLVMRLRREGMPLRLADYSLAAMAAQSGRFARPGADPRSVLSTCRYGMHLDCAALAALLRSEAASAGIRRLPGPLTAVEHGIDGSIAAVNTVDGGRIEGDLFVDCTGATARLIGTASGAAWEDWSAWLPCDRVLSARVGSPHAPPPYSHSQAHRAGWIRQLPLQGRILLSGFWSSDTSSDDEALATLRESAGGRELADVQSAPIRFGRRSIAWHRNCVALGPAAAIIDPVAMTNLQLLRVSIDRLMRLLPAGRSMAAAAAEYNRQTGLLLDHARDFALLHYKLNGRQGEAFWDACRTVPVPSPLEYRMRLYQSRGRVAMYDEEPLDEAGWITLFDEHGVRPHRGNPIADGFKVADLQAHVERARAIMIEELRKMPSHADYLARLKAAQPSRPPADAAASRRHEQRRVGRFMGDSS